MRRSHLAALALVLAGAATATYVYADAFSCQDAALSRCKKLMASQPKSCQLGLGSCKKACCEPPPCQYRFQLTMYIMLQDLFASPEIQACANGDIEKYVGEHLAYTPAFQNHLPNCPKKFHGHTVDPPPSFSTTTSDGVCGIYGTVPDASGSGTWSPMTPELAHKSFNTCSEFLDVNFKHENVHMENCANTRAHYNPYPSVIQSDMAWDEVEAYQMSIFQMRDAFKHWSPTCTPEHDLQKAEKQAQRGIRALKKQTARAAAKGKCP